MALRMQPPRMATVFLWMNAALFAQTGPSHTVSVIAGDNTLGPGYSGDEGPAARAQLHYPHGIAVDESGNLFIADTGNGVIRRVGVDGTITSINCFGREKPRLHRYTDCGLPIGIVADGRGNVYLSAGDVVLKVDWVHETTTVIAGTPAKPGYSGDGAAATGAQLKGVAGLAMDSEGNLFIAEGLNHTVRKVDARGIITTVAGNHSLGKGYGGDGGPATSAQLNEPMALAVDGNGDLFIADTHNSVIRKVNSTGIISTVAGVYTLGIVGYQGDGGPATRARLNSPEGIAVDHAGNLYIADTRNKAVRRVNATGTISTLSADPSPGKPGRFDDGRGTWLGPAGMAMDKSGKLFIAYIKENVVGQIDLNHWKTGPPDLRR